MYIVIERRFFTFLIACLKNNVVILREKTMELYAWLHLTLDHPTTERLVCWRWGSEQERYSYPEIPYWEWNCYQLGWHGKNLALHFLQRAACCPRGARSFAHRGPLNPKADREKMTPVMYVAIQAVLSLYASACRSSQEKSYELPDGPHYSPVNGSSSMK